MKTRMARIKSAIHPPFCGMEVGVLREMTPEEKKKLGLSVGSSVIYWTRSSYGESWHFGNNLEFIK